MSLAPGSRIGVYEVLGPLGVGGMGEVWRARDTRLARDVALKVLPASLSGDRDRLQRFEREAQVLASLNHPNVGAIYGVAEMPGTNALVLELVEGTGLDERIARGRLPVDEVVAVARQIAEALEYAHERGVVHRDLKPANVKLTPDGRVKVLDFGLAKAVAGDAAVRSDSNVSPTITSLGTIAGVVLGTAAYMSPEQARGTNVDRRADIWSFGAVLWEMLTGKRAFEGDTVSDTLASVLRAPIEWSELPPGTPPSLVRLIRRCLERDARKRLRDIGEARIALEGFGSEPEAPAPPAASSAPAARSPWSLAAWPVAAIVVALAVWGIATASRKPIPPAPVVRFQLPLVDKIAAMGWPRLSPDGTMIAFLGRNPSGRDSIWIRSLDALEPRELAGTEGARRPWWSPDSKHLAYFLGNQLRKIPAAGGPSQLIAEAEGGADGTWGTSGIILFDGRTIDPIRQVSASGGPVTQATHPDAAKGETGHAWPCFLPDGKHYLFLSISSRAGGKSEIRIGALGETSAKPLGPTSSRVEYALGHVLYVLDGTLVAQRFDPARLEFSGEPSPLAERLGTDATAASGFSSSDTGALTYVAGETAGESELLWLDRSGRELSKVGAAAPYRDVAISPDGTRIAYGLADARTGREDIWVRDLRRDVASRLTFGDGNEVWPEWSPDGLEIAYASDKSGRFALCVKEANGAGDERELFKDLAGDVGPRAWSRDGRWLSYNLLPASRHWQVKMLPMQGEPKPVDFAVADVQQRGGVFSPDGRYVAYMSSENGVGEVYVQTFPLGGGKWQISNGGGVMPAWSADGREIFYLNTSGEIVAVPITLGARFEPGIPKPLFKRPLSREGITLQRFAVTPDGQRFLVNAARESRGLPFSVILNWPATLK